MRTLIRRTCLALAVLFGATESLPAAAQLSQGEGDLRVMTYNVDEGTDYLEVTAARSPTEFLIAVGQTITQVRATKPPQRMQAVADQITCGPVALEFDMLQELTNALAAKGAAYEVAAQVRQFAFPPVPGLIPPGTFQCVQVINHNVILARSDLDPTKFKWGNAQSGLFASALIFNTPLGPFPASRAWLSVDAEFNGRAFRFIGTHLESADPNIQRSQAAELRAVPANTSLPVVAAMDSNAQAAPPPQNTTYLDFIAAGWVDAWTKTNRNVLGLTCCQAQLDNNPVSQLYQRVDLILTLGNIVPQNIALFGIAQDSKTADGLWPSDHAGVAAQLLVQ